MKTSSFNQPAHDILIFRRWGRKSYSSFLTLKRTIAISVLSVVYFLSTPVISLAIEQDTTEIKMEYDLDEIEVNAQRTPALYSQVARMVSVIERKEIEAAPVQSVQDLLEYIAGVDVRQRGPEGVQADISIRGGTFDQILVLLNGINITDPQTGHHNLNLPVSLAQIDRIEVLEGPAARVYGPNAFSGAINIVTRQAENSELGAVGTVGSFGYFDGNITSHLKSAKWGHTIGVGLKKSDGYADNTDFRDVNGFYSNRFRNQKGTFRFQLGASNKGFGANSFYTPMYPDQYEATQTLFTSIRWESSGRFHFSPAVYYRRHQDRFELFRDDPASWYTGHNYHLTNVYGANLNTWTQWKPGKTALGVEFRSQNILSNVLGKDLDEPQKVPGEDAFFTMSDQQNTWSAFLEHTVFFNNWTFTAGVLANSVSDSGLGVNFFPGFDVSCRVTNKLRLYGSYNTSLRMPTFTDLYYKGPANIGNPDLKPETSETLEGGIKLYHLFFRGHFVIFYRKGHDIIDWTKSDETEIWQPRNLTELTSVGTEVQFEARLQKKLGDYYPNLQVSYLFNKVEKLESDYISRYVLDNLKHKFVGSVSQKLLKNLTLNLQVVFQDREGTYLKYEDTLPAGEAEYQPFWEFDGKLSYKLNNFTFFASVNNLFDVAYNDIENVVQPGRWFKTGVSYQLNIKQ